MDVRQAVMTDAEAIVSFYRVLCADLDKRVYNPRWHWGVYPSEMGLREVLQKGMLHVALESGEVAGAMIVNHEHNSRYNDFDWPEKISDDEYIVLHTLGVATCYSGRGIAKQMLKYAKELAMTQGMKAIRLDVLKGNVPAERLYPAAGFALLGSLPMAYEDIGVVDTELYEWTVPQRPNE